MTDAPGSRAAARIADIAARAFVEASGTVSDGQQARRVVHTTALMEHMEQELAPLCRDALGGIAEMEDCPPEIKALYRAATGPTHQSDLIIQILALLGLALAAPFAAAAGKLQAVKNESQALQQAQPIDPGTAAHLAARGIIGDGFGAQDAKYAGLSGERFAAMVKGSKHAPDTGTMLELVRRGLAGQGLLQEGLQDNGIREGWQAPIMGLLKGPISAGTAVSAAVEGHIDVGQLGALLEANGIDPGYAQLWFDTAGRPPGVVELGALVNRGVMDLGTWEQAIRESDIKNKYIGALVELRQHYPPMRSVVAMMRAGAVDSETGAKWLAYDGVKPEAIAAMVTEATTAKAAKAREVTEGQILSLYGEREIDAGEARQLLSVLRLDPHGIDLLLAHEDAKREQALRNAAAKRVERRFVAHLIDETEAAVELSDLDVPAERQALLLRFWSLERAAEVATLTLAQLNGAAKAGVIEESEWRLGVRAHGYSPHHADVLWETALGAKPTVGG